MHKPFYGHGLHMGFDFKKTRLYLGWVSPIGYLLPYWLFSFCWYGFAKQLRFLGFTITYSRVKE